MTALALYATLSLAALTEAPRALEYLVTAAPITIGAPNGELCVAIDIADPHGVWWWAATGSKVSISRRKNLEAPGPEVPGFDGIPQSPAASGRTIPANVMAALTAKFPQAKLDKWSREKEDGKDVYDIEFRQADRKFEADIFADGTLHNWEQQVALSDLPQPVVQAVSRLFPKAAIKEIMAVTVVTNGSENLEGYEIVVKRSLKKDVEVTIAPDGKVLEGPKKE
jgi:hypothetical protein